MASLTLAKVDRYLDLELALLRAADAIARAELDSDPVWADLRAELADDARRVRAFREEFFAPPDRELKHHPTDCDR